MKNQINRFTIIMLVWVLVLVPSIAVAQNADDVSLGVFVKEALKHNPRIQEAFHVWKAAEHKTKRVKSLDDPTASYGYFGEEVQTRVGPQEQKYGVSQKIPFPGKRRLKGKAQAKHAAMLKEKYEATKNEVIKQVKFTYFDLYWVDHAIQINEEEKSILEKVERVAQRKYESNQIPQQDVIKVQVELSKIIHKIFLLRQNRSSTVVKLKSLLNRSSDLEMESALIVDEVAFDFQLEELLHRVKDSRQELLSAQLSVEKAEYEKSLAKMSYLPDFTFGAEYVDISGGSTSLANDGEDAWMGKVSVNVPVWFGKLRAHVKEKKSTLLAAQKGKEDVESRVAYEVQDSYFKIKAYKDIVLLYETALIPQAEQAFEASQTGFETGSISFLDWLDTERTYLQTRLAYHKSITDFHKSLAYLERVVGGNLKEDPHEK